MGRQAVRADMSRRRAERALAGIVRSENAMELRALVMACRTTKTMRMIQGAETSVETTLVRQLGPVPLGNTGT